MLWKWFQSNNILNESSVLSLLISETMLSANPIALTEAEKEEYRACEAKKVYDLANGPLVWPSFCTFGTSPLCLTWWPENPLQRKVWHCFQIMRHRFVTLPSSMVVTLGNDKQQMTVVIFCLQCSPFGTSMSTIRTEVVTKVNEFRNNQPVNLKREILKILQRPFTTSSVSSTITSIKRVHYLHRYALFWINSKNSGSVGSDFLIFRFCFCFNFQKT